MNDYYKRIAIVGDGIGIPQLLNFIPIKNIACFIVASLRPQYIEVILELGKKIQRPLLIQPKYNSPLFRNFLANFIKHDIDLLICNCYSMILPSAMLQAVNYNAVNFHAALLPFNRGPNPIQWAIIKNENKTGITMHYMDNGIDSGDIIAQRELDIEEDDTWSTLLQKAECELLKLMEVEFPLLLAGNNKRLPQNELMATYNKRLDPLYPKINFNKMSDREVFNLIRAQVEPLRGAYIDEPDGRRIYFNKYEPYSNIAALRKKYGKK